MKTYRLQANYFNPLPFAPPRIVLINETLQCIYCSPASLQACFIAPRWDGTWYQEKDAAMKMAETMFQKEEVGVLFLLRKKMSISLIYIECHIYRGPVRDFTSG